MVWGKPCKPLDSVFSQFILCNRQSHSLKFILNPWDWRHWPRGQLQTTTILLSNGPCLSVLLSPCNLAFPPHEFLNQRKKNKSGQTFTDQAHIRDFQEIWRRGCWLHWKKACNQHVTEQGREITNCHYHCQWAPSACLGFLLFTFGPVWA